MAILVRPAAAADLARLGEIVVGAYAAIGALEGDEDYARELRDVARRAAEAVVLEAMDVAGGVPLGCVTYVPDAANPFAEGLRDGEAAIRMLAVDPAAQGRGVGTALVGACIDRARSEGRRAVVLHSLPIMADAQRIYDRAGFRRAPDRDWRVAGLHLMAFALDLREPDPADAP